MIVVASVATRGARSLTRRKRATQFAKHAFRIAGLFDEVSLIAMSLVDNSDMRIRRFLTEDICLRSRYSNQFLQILFLIVEEKQPSTSTRIMYGRRRPEDLRYIWQTALMQLLAVFLPPSGNSGVEKCRIIIKSTAFLLEKLQKRHAFIRLYYLGNILLLFMFLFPRSCTSQIAFSLT